MKRYIKLLPVIIFTGVLWASCADEFDTTFNVEKPGDITLYEYLNAYDDLKTYINRNAYPGFKLGGGITVSDFLNRELVYSMAAANFDEVVAGNAMKYSSVVSSDGSMDFSQIEKFVSAAQDVGLGIYGHTLVWHAQQNNSYLNSLIAPIIIPGESGNGGYCLLLENPTALEQEYSAQVWYELSQPLESGTTYTLNCMARATGTFNPSVYLQSSITGSQNYPGGFTVGPEWNEVNFTFTPSDGQMDKIAINFGLFAGTIYLDNIVITADNSTVNLVDNGDFEDMHVNGWNAWNTSLFRLSDDGDGYSDVTSGGYCMKFNNATAGGSIWDAQVWYQLPTPLAQGTPYTLTFMAKATQPYTSQVYLQSTTSSQQNYSSQFPIGMEWTEITLTLTPDQDVFDKVTFNFGTFTGSIFVDNVKIVADGTTNNLMENSDFEEGHVNNWVAYNTSLFSLSEDGEGYIPNGEIIEKTPEEKKEILTNALEAWISGMLEVCDGYVKAWDVVNEPMSDGNTNELKSDPNNTDTDNFYWQDYLGKDYARIAIQLARKHGGDDMVLFINDYNLEATYNNNAKCEGLINMVKYWESDGITRIDGIGTQMHVSYNMNTERQKKQEECIVKMYELLAATGKLIKVSELDMGILDENGDAIKTVDVTFEQHQLMADFYKFIIQKYFEIIPASQQYGITQWAATDSPDNNNSFWRRGEPIGLWDLNYNRKPAYGGFADGLNGN